MNLPASKPPSPDKPWSRDFILRLLNSSLAVGEKKYTRQVALAWLAVYPGDLQVRLMHTKALYLENQPTTRKQALHLLEELTQLDPEYIDAHRMIDLIRGKGEQDKTIQTAGCLVALGGTAYRQAHGHPTLPKWASQIRGARQVLIHLKSGGQPSLDKAENLVHQALIEKPNTPLVAVTHMRLMIAKGTLPNLAIRSLASAYLEQWPSCLPLMLFLADALMDGGESDHAVALLHRAVSLDLAGQVPLRLWGSQHPYRTLWPEILEITPNASTSPQNLPIPAAVTSAFGWNQLPEAVSLSPDVGQTFSFSSDQPVNLKSGTEHNTPPPHSTNRTPPFIPEPFQADIERIAAHLKQPHLAQKDGRFPVYVVFTTRLGLEKQYGLENATLLETAMIELVQAVRGRRITYENWGAMLFFADDPQHTAALEMQPARYNDPWSLKLSLADLDNSLGTRGEKIGAVLIVGGPEVIPFHHLPNPVEDADHDVPSDNPYTTRDDNFFVGEWPVGRLPGGSGSDPTPLLHALHEITTRHANQVRPNPWYVELWQFIRKMLSTRNTKSQSSFGYSAAIWRRASLSVFRSIGEPKSLVVSPPVQACDIHGNHRSPDPSLDPYYESAVCLVLPSSRAGYFNLHGLPDTSEWYGQRDPTDPVEGPDFPIALRPQDIRNSGHSPQVVFSEACYGAFIHNKTLDEALSLKFLASGSQAVIGSTCICYGSIATPLIAADLLGRVFLSLLTDGFTAGEALRRAKLYLAREMHRRQGFLDGEDQKTLISFVLYGDPLAQPYNSAPKSKATKLVPSLPAQINTVCDRMSDLDGVTPIPHDVTAHVRQVVSQYLPGMTDATISLTHEHMGTQKTCSSCSSCSQCPTAHMDEKNHPPTPERQVVVLSKKVEQADLIHQQYARLTLDPAGKLVKLAVSR